MSHNKFLVQCLCLMLLVFIIRVTFADEKKPAENNPEMRHGWSVITGSKRTTPSPTDAESIARGKLVFQNHCATCHGKTGKGDGALAKGFAIKPADLRTLAKQKPDHYLFVQINEGKGDMPRWKDLLTNQQITDVTSYLNTLE